MLSAESTSASMAELLGIGSLSLADVAAGAMRSSEREWDIMVGSGEFCFWGLVVEWVWVVNGSREFGVMFCYVNVVHRKRWAIPHPFPNSNLITLQLTSNYRAAFDSDCPVRQNVSKLTPGDFSRKLFSSVLRSDTRVKINTRQTRILPESDC